MSLAPTCKKFGGTPNLPQSWGRRELPPRPPPPAPASLRASSYPILPYVPYKWRVLRHFGVAFEEMLRKIIVADAQYRKESGPLAAKSGKVIKAIGRLLNEQIKREVQEQIFDKVNKQIIEPVNQLLE